MPLYEGIALIQEKQAVVLDIGEQYTKWGFAGEAAPRAVCRSAWWCERQRRLRPLHHYSSEQQLYHNLVHFLHKLYFRDVLVNPKERRVVVVESPLATTQFRSTLARALYDHYEVAAALWAPAPQMCALALGAGSVLVVSLGWREAEVTPVCCGALLVHALHAGPLGARALHARLAHLLRDDNDDPTLVLQDEVLEDIKVKTCFVGGWERAAAWSAAEAGEVAGPAPAIPVQYPCAAAPGGLLRVSGRTRELAAEVMFAQDNERDSLPDLILKAIQQSPVDERRALAGNMVVCGGGAMLPGLRARLLAELRRRTASPPYRSLPPATAFKLHTPPCKENIVAWLGGALAGGTEAWGARGVSREQWTRERRLRDWPDLRDNLPPARAHWRPPATHNL